MVSGKCLLIFFDVMGIGQTSGVKSEYWFETEGITSGLFFTPEKPSLNSYKAFRNLR